MKQAEFTSKSTMTEENGTYRFTFFCERCDKGYTTQPIHADSVKEAFDRAQQQVRKHFNRCHSCYRWVCDGHYNEDLMMCTVCAPRKQREEE